MSYDPDSGPAKPARDSGDLERSMRRTLGVGATGTGQRRRFARDGDVPVVVVRSRRDDGRDAAPDAAHQEREARGRAERSLATAQAMIRDLRTQLAHMEMSQSELRQSFERVSGERQALELALDAETAARRAAEERLHHAAADRRTLPPQPAARPAARPGPAASQPVDWWSKHER